jgi:apolipoprotein N-acyltransferase
MALPYKQYLYFFLLGSAFIFSFAPYQTFYLPIVIFFFYFLILEKSNNKISSTLFFGFGYFFVGLYWLIPCLVNFANTPIAIAILGHALLASLFSLYFLPLAYIKNLFSAILFFSSLEIVRAYALTGFPWLSVGFSQINNPFLSNYLSWIGVHGTTFITLTIAVLLFNYYKNRNLKYLLIILFIFITGYLIGQIKFIHKNSTFQKYSLIQGNISQNIKWDLESLEKQVNTYVYLLNNTKGDVLIFPETTLPLIFKNYPERFLTELNKKIVLDNNKIILGSIINEGNNYYNAAAILSENETKFYKKEHLVPFGEYLPLEKKLNKFYKNILNIPFSSLSKPNHESKKYLIGNQYANLNICYEDIFSQTYYADKSEIFINLTNDAWYGNSPAAAQHLQIAQTRAAEFGRPILRATNTGETAYINEKGKVLNKLEPFQQNVLEIEAYGTRGHTPFYYLRDKGVLVIILSILLSQNIICLLYRKLKSK